MKSPRFVLREILGSRSAVGVMAFAVTSAQAQVVHDGTLGPAHTHHGNNIVIPETLGSLSGRNLFHSFSEFNLSSDQLAEFTGNSSIANVISRVTGSNASMINGVLKSSVGNADFFFVNPAGVTFGPDGSVDVPASFFVSTADRLEFVNGEEFVVSTIKPTLSIFDPRVSGFLKPGLSPVVILGNLTVTDESNFTIVSSDLEVANGSISGSGGDLNIIASDNVILGDSSSAAVLSMSDGGSIKIDASGNVTVNEGTLISANTSSEAGGGIITINGASFTLASGATVSTTAEEYAGSDVSWSETSAEGPQQQNNEIVVGAELIEIAGRVEADGASGDTGGVVKITGGQVTIESTAEISADGDTGGGVVAIGGGYQGETLGSGLVNSSLTVVEQGASISADALEVGDGGAVVVWSEERTSYSGSITATGGEISGDGGSVEVSGVAELGFYGDVDTTAESGKIGTLLLDPTDIVVQDVADPPGSEDDSLLAGGVLFSEGPVGPTPPPGTAYISAGAIEAAGADVTLQATNSVLINDLTDNELTVSASNDLTVQTGAGGFSMDSGDTIALSSGGNLTIDATDAGATGAGPVTLGGVSGATETNLTGTDVTFTGAVGTNTLSVNADGAVTQTAPLTVAGAADLTAAGAITLNDVSNDFGGAVSASGVNITLSDTDELDLGTITSTGDVVVDADGTVTQSGAADIGGSLRVTAEDGGDGFDVALTNASNDITGEITVTAAEDVSITNTVETVLGVIHTQDDSAGVADTTIGNGNNGDLTVTSSGAVSQAAGDELIVPGETVVNASGFTVALDDGDNNFTGSVSASGTTITLSDTDEIELGDIDAAGDLIVTADGTITDGAVAGLGSDVDVGGLSVISSTGSVVLNDSTHDFGGAVSASGLGITLADSNDIVLADIDASGNLSVTVVGEISDGALSGAGSDIDVTGVSAFESTAGASITLNDSTNNFAGAVSADGGAVTLSDRNDIALADIDATGNLSVTAVGAIRDVAEMGVDGDINVVGRSVFESVGSADITLNDTTNDFGGAVSADGGSISIADSNDVVLGDIDASGSLSVTAVGSITDGPQTGVGSDINVVGSSKLESTSDEDVVLNDTSNDFGGLVSAEGGSIIVSDSNDIALGDIHAAGSLTVTAAGSISDGAETGVGSDVDVAGASTIVSTGGGSITLNDTTNDFVGGVSANGGTVRLADRNDLVLGDLDVSGNLTATAVGSIVDGAETGAGSDIDVAGVAVFESTGGSNLLLDDTTNDFQSSVNADGANIALADRNDIELGDIDASGNLRVTATGEISDGSQSGAGGDLNVAGVSTFESTLGDNVILNDSTNDFVGSVSVEGGTVRIADSNDLVLQDIDAAGNLSVTAGSSISDGPEVSPGADINVGGISDISSIGGADITLNDTTNDFGGAVSADGGSISIADSNDVVLGDIDASGSLSVTAAGSITDGPQTGVGSDINVVGASKLESTNDEDVVLNDTSNDFGGLVSAEGGSIIVSDSNDIALGDIQAAGSLTVTAAGSISDGAETGVGSDVDVAGASTIVSTGGGSITLNDTTNDFVGGVSANGGTVRLADRNDLVLGDLDVSGNLTATAVGSIVDGAETGAGSDIDVTGVAVFESTGGSNLLLDDATNDFQSSVNADGANIALADRNDIEAGDIDASGNLSVTVAGTIHDGPVTGAGSDINVDGTSAFTSTGGGNITLNDSTNNFDGGVSASGGVVSLADANDIRLADIDATGTLSVTVAGAISDGAEMGALADIDVAGASTFVSTGGADITLNDTTNEFSGSVSVDGGSVVLADTNNITLGDIDATGSLRVTATGTITDGVEVGVGEDINVVGSSAFNSIDDENIILNDTSNDFGRGVSADGGTIHLSDINDINLADIDADRNLRIIANDEIRDGAENVSSADVDVRGTSTFTSNNGSDIVLNDPANNFVGPVSADGATVRLADRDNLILGDIDATGNLTATAVGSIVDGVESGAGSDVDVVGVTVFESTGGANILVDDTTNDFQKAVNASGQNVALADRNDILLGDIDATGNLRVIAAESISDGPVSGAGSDIDVVGASAFVSTNDNDITLNDVTNNFGGAVSVGGGTVTIVDSADIVLGDIDAVGSLSVMATGTITDGSPSAPGSDINVAGASDFESSSNSNIILNDIYNDFGRSVSANGGTIHLADTNDIALGDIDANASVEVVADGTISDGGETGSGADLDIRGGSTFTSVSGSNITLNDTTNNFAGPVSIAGAAIRLTDRNDLVLGDIDATGNFTGIAVGSIVDGSETANGSDVDVAGITVFESTGNDNILVDDTTNNLQQAVNAMGANIALGDRDAIVLGDIDAGGNLRVTAAGSISDGPVSGTGSDINVTGVSSFETMNDENIIVNDSTNDFSGSVSANGGTIHLTDVNDVELADIDADRNLVVTAEGTIRDGVEAGSSADIDVRGVSQFTSTGGANIVLNDSSNNFSGAVSADGSSIALADRSDLVLGDIDATDGVTAIATGSIVDGDETGINGDIDVAGVAVFESTGNDNVLVDDTTNNFEKGVHASGANVALGDRNAIVLRDIDASGNLRVTAADSISDGPVSSVGSDINVAGTSSFVSTGNANITMNDETNSFGQSVSAQGGSITLVDSGDIVLGDVDAAGNLSVTVAGAISDGPRSIADSDINVAGASTFESINDANIILNDATNDFGRSVSANGGTVYLSDINDIALGDIDADGSLQVIAEATITDGDETGSGADLDVRGVSRFVSIGDGNITLNDTSNNFAGALSADGAVVRLADRNDLVLGDIDASGNLHVIAADSISDGVEMAGSSDIDVSGTSTFISTGGDDVTLNDNTNDFGKAVAVSGNNIRLADKNRIRLGDIDALGDLTVIAQNDVTDGEPMGSGDDVNVDGDTSITSIANDSVILNDAGNDFAGSVSLSGGQVYISDANDLDLNLVDSEGNVSVIAGGDLKVSNDIATDGGGVSVQADGTIDIEGDITIIAPGPRRAGTISIGPIDNTSDTDVIISGSVQTQNLEGTKASLSSPPSDIVITASDERTITLDPGSELRTETKGAADAGDITLIADSILGDDTTIQTTSNFDDATGSAGRISITAEEDIIIKNSLISSEVGPESAGGGEIVITPLNGVLDLENTVIDTKNFSDADQPEKTFSGSEVIINFTASSEAFGEGDSGDIIITSPDIRIIEKGVVETKHEGEGDAGNVIIDNQGGTLQMNTGGSIDSSSKGTGAPGRVVISNTDSVVIDATPYDGAQSSIKTSSGADSTATDNLDLIGNIQITGNQGSELIIVNSGVDDVTSDNADSTPTTGPPDGPDGPDAPDGVVIDASSQGDVDAGDITISGFAVVSVENAEVSTQASGRGDGGVITFTDIDEISLDASATVNAEAVLGPENQNFAASAGDIVVLVDALSIDNGSSVSTSTNTSGSAGEVSITVDGDMTMAGAGEITSSSTASGDAGTVRITAENIAIEEGSKVFSTSESDNPNLLADAGKVIIHSVGEFSLDNSEISTTTRTRGHAGDVSINADAITIDGSLINSKSESGSRGDAGTITLASHNEVVIEGSTVSSSSDGSGNAGFVSLQGTTLLLDDESMIESTTTSSDPTFSADAGEVTLEFENNITISSSNVSTSTTTKSTGSGQIGSIEILTDTLEVVESQITSSSSGQGSAGSVQIAVDEAIFESSEISTSTQAGGIAGDILVGADELLALESRFVSEATLGSSGKAGTITLEVDGDISLLDQSEVSSSSEGSGNAGEVSVTADNLLVRTQSKISSETTSTLSNIEADAGMITLNIHRAIDVGEGSSVSTATSTANTNSGELGVIDIDAPIVNVFDSEIVSSTSGAGVAGNIDINSGEMTISGATIASQALPGSSGDAGSVTIDNAVVGASGQFAARGNLIIQDGGSVTTSSLGAGTPGLVEITRSASIQVGGEIANVSGTDSNSAFGGTVKITDSTALTLSEGGKLNLTSEGDIPAGNITIELDDLTLAGGELTTSSNGAGDAGSIILDIEDTLVLTDDTLIESTTKQSGSQVTNANAGSISIHARDIDISNGVRILTDTETNNQAPASIHIAAGEELRIVDSQVSSSTSGTGDAGNILITADVLDILDGASIKSDSTSADATIGGAAGSIDLRANELLVSDDNVISTNTATSGVAGDISISVTESLLVVGSEVSSSSQASGSGPAGTIRIDSDDEVIFSDSTVSSSSLGSGNAGRVDINAVTLDVLEESVIESATESSIQGTVASAGSININTDEYLFLSNGSSVVTDTTTVTAIDPNTNTAQLGEINIDTEELTLVNGVISSSSRGLGDAGTISINVKSSVLNDESSIKSEALGGNSSNAIAGSILIESPDQLTVTSGSSISTNTNTAGRLDSSGEEGLVATIDLASGELLVRGGRIQSDSAGSGSAGQITVDNNKTLENGKVIRGSLLVTQGGGISSSSTGAGTPGSVQIENSASILLAGTPGLVGDITTQATNGVSSGSVTIIDSTELTLSSGASINLETTGSGPAGDITIDIDEGVVVTDNGSITSSTRADGDAGSIYIKAKSFDLSAESAVESLASEQGVAARAGTVEIEVQENITISGGSRISTSTASDQAQDSDGSVGDGRIELAATDINIVESSITSETSGDADAGEVSLFAAGTLSLSAESSVSSSSTGDGDAGSISISAQSASLSERSVVESTTSKLFSEYSDINAGAVSINVSEDLLLTAQSRISTNTVANGEIPAEVVVSSVSGDILLLDSTITSETTGAGQAGGIVVSATDGDVLLGQASSISSSSEGLGNAGQIILSADNVNLADNSAVRSTTEIGVSSFGPEYYDANAGSVEVFAQENITLSMSAISTNTSTAGTEAAKVNLVSEFGDVLLSESSITSESSGAGPAGEIQVDSAQGQVNLLMASSISSSTTGEGNANKVTINTPMLSVEEFSTVQSRTTGAGAADAVVIDSANTKPEIDETDRGLVTLTSGGKITSSSDGSGPAGSVTITNSEVISLTGHDGGNEDVGGDRSLQTQISIQASGATLSSDVAGQVTIENSGLLSVTEGALINAETGGSSSGGDIAIAVNNMSLDAGVISSRTFSGEGADPTASAGDAGNISITTTDTTSLSNGSLIRSNSATDGDAGEVVVSAASVSLTDSSGISSDAESASSIASAGSVAVVTSVGDVSLDSGSRVSTLTAADGQDAGSITVTALNGSVSVTGVNGDEINPGLSSAITSETTGDGPAGEIEITANQGVELYNTGEVSSGSGGSGDPGTITVRASELTISSEFSEEPDAESVSDASGLLLNDDTGSTGAVSESRTGIFTESSGPGNDKRGGSINIFVSGLTEVLEKGQISARAEGSNNPGGSILIDTDRLSLDGGESWENELAAARLEAEESGTDIVRPDGPQITATSAFDGESSDGGDITIKAAGSELEVDEYAVSLNAGGQITASSSGTGPAGDISIISDSIKLTDRSTITNNNDNGVSEDDPGNAGKSNGGTIFLGSEVSLESSENGDDPVRLKDNTTIVVDGRSTIESGSVVGDSGSVELSANSIILEDAVIETNAGDPETGTGSGEAGQININSDTLGLQGGVNVTSNATSGVGGKIVIDTNVTIAEGGVNLGGDRIAVADPLSDDPYSGNNVIQAVSDDGITGTLDLSSPIFDVSAVVNDLNTVFSENTNLVRNPCAAFVEGAPSTLAEIGTGGLPLIGTSGRTADVTNELFNILDDISIPGIKTQEEREEEKNITDFLFVPSDGLGNTIFSLGDTDALGHDCERGQ